MLHLDFATRRSVVGTLYTATDVAGGQTKEQRGLLEALALHVMRVPPSAAATTSPQEAAAAIEKPRLRRAVGEILAMLELVRHPPSSTLTSERWSARPVSRALCSLAALRARHGAPPGYLT
jgi:hypothetical protein